MTGTTGRFLTVAALKGLRALRSGATFQNWSRNAN